MNKAYFWQEDLAYLANQIRTRHANPYHQISREQFDAAVNGLHERIPQLERHQIVVEMARIIAMIGDGHTSCWLTSNPSLKFHRYPLHFYQFSDGIFVYEAEANQRQYLGTRLTRIGDHPVEKALRQVESVISRDNDMGLKLAAAHALSIPEVLHALGIIGDMNSAEFTFADAQGKLAQVRLYPLEMEAEPHWIKLYENETPLAHRWKQPEQIYWFEYLVAQQTVYVQLRAVRDRDDEPLTAFYARLFEFIEEHPVERLIIDLRSNSGGNNMLNQPLVHGLICSPKVNQRGKLFTLIGRYTFSAAMNLAVDLERNTKTLFVGEPTGSSPNFYGETSQNTMPHSGITFSVSALYWQSSLPYDQRPWIEPHIHVEMSSTDYRNNIDPALDTILSYVHDDSLYDYEPVKYPF